MRTLASFRDVHFREKLVVCGCGSSLKDLEQPERFVTIGVNDVGRLFQPKYLLVVDPKERFKDGRFRYVETSQAEYLFTQVRDLDVAHPNIVNFNLGKKGGTDFSDPNALHYSVVTPYVALYLAAYMGANPIGLMGIDFTDHHFFGDTGPHAWTPYLADIDAHFHSLGVALLARGIQVFNLSSTSRLTAFPKMALEDFAALPAACAAEIPALLATPDSTGRGAGVSIVVVSLNEGEHLRRTVDNLKANLPGGGEIVVVDDGSEDGSANFLGKGYESVTVLRPSERLGSARARNFGAQHSRGKVLVFCDAHVAVSADWAGPLLEALRHPDTGAVMPSLRAMRYPGDYISPALTGESRGYGMRWRDAALNVEWLSRRGSEPYAAPLLSAAFLAIRRNLFAAVGGFDSGLIGWGPEGEELSLRLWLLGYECLVVPEVDVAHQFRSQHPYRVEWETVLYNKLRLAAIHFRPERRQRVVERLRKNGAFPAAMAKLDLSDAEQRRAQAQPLRRYDDDWFFEKFRCEWTSELAGYRLAASSL